MAYRYVHNHYDMTGMLFGWNKLGGLAKQILGGDISVAHGKGKHRWKQDYLPPANFWLLSNDVGSGIWRNRACRQPPSSGLLRIAERANAQVM